MPLPICKPSIISYLHHANPLAILETDQRPRHFLINQFLQLHARPHHAPGLKPGVIVDFYSYDGMYPRLPFLSHSWLSAPMLQCLGGNLIEQVCALLDAGNYVEILVDEFYVPDRIAYRNFHFPHQNLLYGYDKAARQFYTQAFDAKWVFKKLTLSFEDLLEGFGPGCGLAIINWSDAHEYSNSQVFSTTIVRTYLQDFIAARTSFVSYRPVDAHYGTDCYRVALAMLDGVRGDQIDIRAWCVFYEHKQKLVNLYQYLLEQQKIHFNDVLFGDLKWLANDFMTIRNHILEAKLSDDTVDITLLWDNLDALSRQENGLIADVLSALA
jgi:hypothetical protein